MNISQENRPVALAGAIRKRTAVSQVLRALNTEVENHQRAWTAAPAVGGFPGSVIVANDAHAKRRAWQLAYRVYAECGYVAPDCEGLMTSAFDHDPGTFTLLVEDEAGTAMATVTLVFDSEMRLPCDEIFEPELEFLRSQGRKVAEVTRLAIDERHTGSKALLVTLFNFIFVYARRIRGYDDFVIEVNPRHVNYYRRLLRFEVAGSERPCPRVNGAPAVLLRVELEKGVEEVRRVGGMRNVSSDRTLYPYFYPWTDSCEIFAFLNTPQVQQL